MIGDSKLLLMPFHPLPVNSKGKGVWSGVDDLDSVKAWLCKIDARVSGAVNCGFTIQGDSDLSGRDVALSAEDVKEAEGAQDPRKFAAM